MKIRKVIDKRIHNLLMRSDVKTPYVYKVDGIYLETKWVSKNLTKYYMVDSDGCLDFLEKIYDNEETPYKVKVTTRGIINDFIKGKYDI